VYWPIARLRARRGYFARRDWAGMCAGRVAVVACHWVGDTFWATQVIAALARRFEGAELCAITKPACVDLWHGLVELGHVLTAPEVTSDRRRERASFSAIRRRAGELAGENFDLVIDLTGNRYSAWFTFCLRPARSLGFDGGELGWLYSGRSRLAERVEGHLSERPFRVIEPLLGGQENPFAYHLPLRPPQPTVAPEAIAGELGVGERRYTVLAPGAGWPAKCWPGERFVQVGRLLADAGLAVVVAGAAAEESLCRQVGEAIDGAKIVVGRPIGQVVALLSGAAGVVCNDSGLGHLAAALGVRTASVFTGATDPATCRPLGPDDCSAVFSAEADAEQVFAFVLTG
jgi:heptosyltransferase-1